MEPEEQGEVKEFNHDEEKVHRENLTNKMRENPWILSTFILGVLALMFLVGNFGVTGNVSAEEAGQNLLKFANTQGPSELIGIKDNGDFYEVTILFNEQNIPLYVTKDGKYFTQALVSLVDDSLINDVEGSLESDSNNQKLKFSEEDNLKIQSFSLCVAEKGFRVYAADWCPHCEDMKEYFGGQENVEPFWIVCSDASRNPTENVALCDEEGITSFPTMKLDGEVLNIPRTFEAIAEVTGCSTPQLV